MSKFWKFAGVTVLVAVLVVGGVAAVSAQTPTPSTGNKALNLWERMHEAIAKALGITVEQYDSAVEAARDDVLKQAVEEGLLTQEQADHLAERWQDGMGFKGLPFWGKRGGGFGGRGWGMMGGLGDTLVSVAAEKLGMTVEELRTELEADKTIADVAEAKGVGLATIVDAYLAAKEERVQQMVNDGRITQEQADKLLDGMREQVQKQLEGSFPFRGRLGPDCWNGKAQGSTIPQGTSTLGRLQGLMRRGSY